MRKNIKSIFALFMVLSFSSCLKDDELIGPDADGAVSNIIEFKNIATPASSVTSTYPLYIQAFDIEENIPFQVPVQIAGAYDANEDVKVTIELDNSILDSYNEENDTEYIPLDASYYNIPSLEITIPRGQRTANLLVNLLTDKFDFDNSYALGFRIKSSSLGTISGNFGAIAVAISAKNELDGQYRWTGSFTDEVSPAFVHATTRRTYTVELHTMGPDEVALFDPYVWGDYLYPFYTGTGWSGYGSFAPIFKFDLQTNKIIAVRNYYGVPSNTRTAELDPAGENSYDPATGVIKVSYFMKQPSFVPASPNIRTRFTETFTFVGAR